VKLEHDLVDPTVSEQPRQLGGESARVGLHPGDAHAVVAAIGAGVPDERLAPRRRARSSTLAGALSRTRCADACAMSLLS
jgi:hypothetical protein